MSENEPPPTGEATVVVVFTVGPEVAHGERRLEQLRHEVAGAVGRLGLADPESVTVDALITETQAEQSPEESIYPDGFEFDERLDITSDVLLAPPADASESQRNQSSRILTAFGRQAYIQCAVSWLWAKTV